MRKTKGRGASNSTWKQPKIEWKAEPKPTLPLPSQNWGRWVEEQGRAEEGATHIVWFKGVGALAVERQESGHCLPEARDQTER